MDSVRGNGHHRASRDVIDDVGLIGVVNRIAIIDVSLCTELWTMNSLKFHAIEFPHVIEIVVDILITVFVNHVSGNIQLGALTNVVRNEVDIVVDGNNTGNLIGNDDRHRHRIAVSNTTGGSLLNTDSVHNVTGDTVEERTRDMVQDTGSTIVNIGPGHTAIEAVLPDSNQVVHIPIAEMRRSGNLAVRTNLSVVDSSNNFGLSTNIDIIRLALHMATLGSGHHNREDVRIILSRES